MRIARCLILAGSVVLLLTALLHGSGYVKASTALDAGGAFSFKTGGFKMLWLAYSIHLVVVSAIATVASFIPKGRRIILLCTLIPGCDAVLLLHFVRIFIGTICLGIATLLFLAGGLMMPKGEASQ